MPRCDSSIGERFWNEPVMSFTASLFIRPSVNVRDGAGMPGLCVFSGCLVSCSRTKGGISINTVLMSVMHVLWQHRASCRKDHMCHLRIRSSFKGRSVPISRQEKSFCYHVLTNMLSRCLLKQTGYFALCKLRPADNKHDALKNFKAAPVLHKWSSAQ